MPTKRCQICGSYKRIDQLSVSCKDCEPHELDLLMAVYAYIHLTGNEYCPINDILENIGEVRKISPSITFIKSWLSKQWLQKNEVESLRVPPSLKEELEECGFEVTPEVLATLSTLKGERPKYDPTLLKGMTPNKKPDPMKVSGMVYMSKKRD